jgi:hypothetical protein
VGMRTRRVRTSPRPPHPRNAVFGFRLPARRHVSHRREGTHSPRPRPSRTVATRTTTDSAASAVARAISRLCRWSVRTSA